MVPPYITGEGESLVVLGSRFSSLGSVKCVFDAGDAALKMGRGIILNTSAVLCDVPKLQAPGRWIGLRVSPGDAAELSTASRPAIPSFQIRYSPLPIVISAGTLVVSSVGGSTLEFVGYGLMAPYNLRCSFPDHGSMPFTALSPNLGACSTPIFGQNVSADLLMLNVEAVSPVRRVFAAFVLQLVKPPVVMAITPSIGLSSRSTDLLVSTNNEFLADISQQWILYCDIGYARFPAFAVNESSVRCTAPPSPHDTSVPVTVGLINASLPRAADPAYFAYSAPIKLQAVLPGGNAVVGGQVVKVLTEDPVHGHVYCAFDSSLAPATSDDPRALTCQAPIHPAGWVSLRLANEDGEIVSANALMLEYILVASTSSMFPSNGIIHKSTRLAIRAQGLSLGMGMRCVFKQPRATGGVLVAESTASVVMADWCECSVPDKLESLVEVLLSVLAGNTSLIEERSLQYVDDVIVQSMTPRVGTTRGGVSVRFRVEPTLPRANYSCMFGPVIVLSSLISDSESAIECVAPPAEIPEVVGLSVSANGVDYFSPMDESMSTFRYTTEPSAASYSPHVGTVGGGTTLLITGDGFDEGLSLWCVFGYKTRVEARWINSTATSCEVPESDQTLGFVAISLCGQDGAFCQALDPPFSFVSKLSDIKVSPSVLPRNFDGAVRVWGPRLPFSDEWMCRIESATISSTFGATWISSTDILCAVSLVGLALPDTATVAISANGQEWSQPVAVNVSPALAVRSASPTLVMCTNPPEIELTGVGFTSARDLACVFDGVPVPVKLVSESVVRCRTPTLSPNSSVRVTVSGFGDFVADGSVTVKCIPPFLLERLSPTSAWVSGGTTITLEGSMTPSSAQDNLRCCFDRSKCVTGSFVNQSAIECVTPVSAAGLTTVFVSVGGANAGWVNSMEVPFEFVLPPVFHNVLPRRIPVSTGTLLAISGVNFESWREPQCVLRTSAGDYVLQTRWRSDKVYLCGATELSFILPLFQPIVAEVLVRADALGDVDTGFNMTLTPPPELRNVAVTGRSGERTAQYLSLEGFDFDQEGSFFCRFDYSGRLIASKAHVINETRAICPLPGIRRDSNVSALLSLWMDGNGEVDRGGSVFEVNLPTSEISEAWSLSPSFGSRRGGQIAFVRSDALELSEAWKCCFDSAACVPLLSDAAHDSFWIRVPPSNESALVAVGLTDARGELLSTQQVWYQYSDSPTVFSVSPNRGKWSGGNDVVVSGTGFASVVGLRCLFGATFSTATAFFDNQAICSVPTQSTEIERGRVVPFALTYSDPSDQSSELSAEVTRRLEYEFVDVPVVTAISVSVTRGDPTVGGTDITRLSIAGSNFLNGSKLSCRTGRAVFPAELFEQGRIVCSTGLSLSAVASRVKVAVSNDGDMFSDPIDSVLETWMVGFQAHSLHPRMGTVKGGNDIWVIGVGFSLNRTTSCAFGWENRAVDSQVARVVNATHAICQAPAKTADRSWRLPIALRVEPNAVTSNFLVYSYVDEPVVLSVEPSRVVSGLATRITVRGYNFSFTPQGACLLRPNASLDAHTIAPTAWRSSEEIICILPDTLKTGTFEVCLSPNSIGDGYCGQFIKAVDSPEVIRIVPHVGTVHGNTTVLVEMSSIVPELECCFDGLCFPFAMLNGSAGTCLSPPHAAGDVSFSVRSEVLGQLFTDLPFRYIEGPRVFSFSPSVFVSGFTQTARFQLADDDIQGELVAGCHFGALGISNAVELEGGVIECPIPFADFAYHDSTVDVSVILNSSAHGSRLLTAARVEVVEPSFIQEVVPPTVAVSDDDRSSVHLQLKGRFSIPEDGTMCHVSCVNAMKTEIGAVVYASDEEAECVMENGFESPSDCDVGLFHGGSSLTNNTAILMVRPEMVLSTASPSSAVSSGGVNVTAIGAGFPTDGEVMCHFGDRRVNAVVASFTRAICLTPSIVGQVEAGALEMWLSYGSIETKRILFTISEAESIFSIQPSFGPESGGTAIAINSTSIGDDRSSYICLFDGNLSVPAAVSGPTALSCITPSMPTGDHTLELVGQSGGRASNVFVGFETILEEEVMRVDPPAGILSKEFETRVVVAGKNFVDTPSLACAFGDQLSSSSTVFSASKVECVAPFMKAGRQIVRVANDGVDFSASFASFDVLSRMSLARISPAHGPSHGGTIVTLSGVFGNFSGLACTFGDNQVEALVVNSSTVQCIAPASWPNNTVPVNVRAFETYAHIESVSATSFTYQPSFAVISLVPAVVTQTPELVMLDLYGWGLDSIEIVGCQFSNGFTSEASRVDDRLRCSVDARLTGKIHVALATSNFVLDAVLVDQFVRVVPAVQPTRVHPPVFDERGGAELEVTTTNLLPSATTIHCRIGGAVTTGLRLAANKVRCVAPRALPGLMQLQLSQDNVTWSESAIQVEAFGTPTLFEVVPDRALVDGGSLVTVRGTNFRAFTTGARCVFDSVVVPATILNSTTLKCVSPGFSTPRNTSLRIRLNGVDTSLDALEFAFLQRPHELRILTVQEQPESKDLAVIIAASYIDESEILSYECIFDGTPSASKAMNVSSESFVCVSLARRSEARPNSLEVTLHGRVLLEEKLEEYMGCSAKVYGVSRNGRVRYGSQSPVSIFGAGFTTTMPLTCMVGSTIVAAVMKNEGVAECQLPLKPPGRYVLEVRCAATFEALTRLPLEYVRGPTVMGLQPHVFPTLGVYDLEISGADFAAKDRIEYSFQDDLQSTTVPAVFRTSRSITCSTPYRTTAGPVVISIAEVSGTNLPGVLFNTSVGFVDGPSNATESMVEPFFGSTVGGYEISVSLAGMHGSYQESSCKFVGSNAHQYANSTLIVAESASHRLKCVVPLLQSGAYSIQISPNHRDYVPVPGVFRVHQPVAWFSVNPAFAFAGGGTEVTMLGSGFQPWMQHMCGYREANTESWVMWRAIVKSNTTLTCVSRRNRPSKGELQLFPRSALQAGSTETPFQIKQDVTVHSVHPTSGPATSSTMVSIAGQGFFNSPALTCHFLTSKVPAEFENPTLVRCRSPRYLPSTVPVGLSFDGSNIFHAPQPFTFLPLIEIATPTLTDSGRSNASTLIMGVSDLERNDSSLWTCRFYRAQVGSQFSSRAEGESMGKIDQSSDGQNEYHVSCLIPADVPPGTVGVRLTRSDGEMQSNIAIFELPARVFVDRVVPSTGFATGGYNISLFGRSFPTHGAVYCRFGLTESLGYLISAEEVSCSVPEASDGVLNALIYLRFDASPTWIDTDRVLKYSTMPIVHRISPTSGWTRGGTAVSVFGSRMCFSSSIECVLGNTSVPAAFSSSDKVTCYSPAVRDPQQLKLRIRSDGVWWHEHNSMSFQFVQPPTVNQLKPANGGVDGDTEIVLKGNFSSLLAYASPLYCSFGADQLALVQMLREDEMRCVSPPGQHIGSVELGLLIHPNDVLQLPFDFEYTHGPAFDEIVPSVVSEGQDGYVRIHGVNFQDSEGGFCRFGGSTRRFSLTYVNETTIECAHGRLKPGRASVNLSFDGVDELATGLRLDVRKKPTLISMRPQLDDVMGGAVVEFEGINLFFSPSLVCQFGSNWTPATLRGDKITCIVPRAPALSEEDQQINVSLLAEGVPYAEDTFPLTHIQMAPVQKVELAVDNSTRSSWIESTWVCADFIPGIPSYLRVDELDEDERTSYFAGLFVESRGNDSCRRFVINADEVDCGSPCGLHLSVNNQSFVYTGKTVQLESQPRVITASPLLASFRGSEDFRVDGRHFSEQHPLYCLFGDSGPVRALVESDRRLVCSSPQHRPGTMSLEIATAMDSTRATPWHIIKTFSFTFAGAMDIAGITPAAGLDRGGVSVTAHGKGFVDHPSLRCEFGEIKVPATFVNGTHVTRTSPPMFRQENQVAFRVGLGVETTGSVTFSYVPIPTVSALDPTAGVANRRYNIRVMGSEFSPAVSVSCRFGMFPAARCEFVSPTAIICPFDWGERKQSRGPMQLQVRLSYDGVHFFATGQFFKVFRPAVLTGVTPEIVMPSLTKSVKVRSPGFDKSAGWQCHWDAINLTTPGEVISSTEITCSIPPSSMLRPGNIVIRMKRADMMDFASDAIHVEICGTPEIFDFAPAKGSTSSHVGVDGARDLTR